MQRSVRRGGAFHSVHKRHAGGEEVHVGELFLVLDDEDPDGITMMPEVTRSYQACGCDMVNYCYTNGVYGKVGTCTNPMPSGGSTNMTCATSCF